MIRHLQRTVSSKAFYLARDVDKYKTYGLENIAIQISDENFSTIDPLNEFIVSAQRISLLLALSLSRD